MTRHSWRGRPRCVCVCRGGGRRWFQGSKVQMGGRYEGREAQYHTSGGVLLGLPRHSPCPGSSLVPSPNSVLCFTLPPRCTCTTPTCSNKVSPCALTRSTHSSAPPLQVHDSHLRQQHVHLGDTREALLRCTHGGGPALMLPPSSPALMLPPSFPALMLPPSFPALMPLPSFPALILPPSSPCSDAAALLPCSDAAALLPLL